MDGAGVTGQVKPPPPPPSVPPDIEAWGLMVRFMHEAIYRLNRMSGLDAEQWGSAGRLEDDLELELDRLWPEADE